MKRNNVLIFTPLALENGRGGEISAMELANGLQDQFLVTLLDSNRIIGNKRLDRKLILKKLNGINRISRLNYLNFQLFNKNFSFPKLKAIRTLYKEMKLARITYTSLHDIKSILILILLVKLIRKTRLVVGFRKPLYSDKLFSIYNLKNRISIILFKIFKKGIYIHTISQHAKKYLENFYDSKRVFHITHGIELGDYLDFKIEEKNENILKLIYVGYLDDIHKGVGVLIEAIKLLLVNSVQMKISFEFCGTGPLESEVLNLEKNYPKKIKYNGYVSNDQIYKYYRRNDVFLFTSRREPFGRVIIESLAAGLLILCTKTYGSSEILKEKKFAFFVQDLTPQNLYQKIIEIYELWNNKIKELRTLQVLARKYALGNYSLSRELNMFKKLFIKL
ncbi:MAG: glycosyltransferase family 4 protein [Candidatus Hodarchaeota archaeon]